MTFQILFMPLKLNNNSNNIISISNHWCCISIRHQQNERKIPKAWRSAPLICFNWLNLNEFLSTMMLLPFIFLHFLHIIPRCLLRLSKFFFFLFFPVRLPLTVSHFCCTQKKNKFLCINGKLLCDFFLPFRYSLTSVYSLFESKKGNSILFVFLSISPSLFVSFLFIDKTSHLYVYDGSAGV